MQRLKVTQLAAQQLQHLSVSYTFFCLLNAGWQEAFRAEGSGASAPLLGKTSPAGSPNDKDNDKPKNETKTIKALLSMSAVDTPLLMLAFAAGVAMADVLCEKMCMTSVVDVGSV